jgi:hypothetical protein
MRLEKLKKDEVFWFMLALSAIIMTSLIVGAFVPKPAHAAEVPESLAVKAIVGEASGEGYRGMLAVAGAIRNRGSLQRVYGTDASHVRNEPEWVWRLAKKAWEESRYVDLSCGGTDWESTDFPVPYWAKGMIITARVGKHLFYKTEKGCPKSQTNLAKR